MTTRSRGKVASGSGKRRPPGKPLTQGAELLKKWRESAGETCAGAARALDCDPTVLWRVERAERVPSIDFARHLFDVCGIPMNLWHPPGWKWCRPIVDGKRSGRSAA
jgi:transcriptional regulator with XRE-family HTH domain